MIASAVVAKFQVLRSELATQYAALLTPARLQLIALQRHDIEPTPISSGRFRQYRFLETRGRLADPSRRADPLWLSGHRLKALMPQSELHVFRGGDHDLAHTLADGVAPLIDAFLSRDGQLGKAQYAALLAPNRVSVDKT
jgi:hypothetical protein